MIVWHKIDHRVRQNYILERVGVGNQAPSSMASTGAREIGLFTVLRKSAGTIAGYVSVCYAGGLRAFPGKYKCDFIFRRRQNLSD